MTCIVGFVEKGTVFMAGDSAGVSGWDLRVMKHPKVFINNKMIFGYTSSFRMGQLLQYSLKIPAQGDKPDYDYMCTDFIDSVKKCFKDNDYAENVKNVITGGTFLVGYRGNLYKICNDFQVSIAIDGYDACGCGESYALGAMRNLTNPNYSPQAILQKALETAEYFSAGVSGPFTFESLNNEN